MAAAARPFALIFAVACAGIAIYSAMDVTMKLLTRQSGVYAAMLWRCTAGTLLSGAVHLGRRPARPRPGAVALHVERGLVIMVMALMFFWGLARVPMAQAIALCFIAPLLALGLAALLLGERVGRSALVASGIAALGVATIIAGQARSHMGPEAFHGALAVLAAACAYSYNIILMRRQAQLADALEVAFYQNVVPLLVLAIAAPWLGRWPASAQWPVIALAGLFGTMSVLLLAWAYARGGAASLAPSEYSGFVWAALFGFLAFGEVVQPWTLAGAALIVVGCLIAARARPPAAPPVEEMLA